jgi:hypothetical protein
MTRASTLARLDEAITCLLAGRPTCTDGELTISNLCAEAGVGRDSYYRSPQIVEKFVAAKANVDARKPEVLALREELAALKRQMKQQASDAAGRRRELEETVKIYANQIQILALRNNELTGRNQNLTQALERQGVVRRLQPRES